MFVVQEHPVLRHIDDYPSYADESSSSAPFVVIDRSKEQTALCEVPSPYPELLLVLTAS
jgi:kinetochore protein Fta7